MITATEMDIITSIAERRLNATKSLSKKELFSIVFNSINTHIRDYYGDTEADDPCYNLSSIAETIVNDLRKEGIIMSESLKRDVMEAAAMSVDNVNMIPLTYNENHKNNFNIISAEEARAARKAAIATRFEHILTDVDAAITAASEARKASCYYSKIISENEKNSLILILQQRGYCVNVMNGGIHIKWDEE